MKSYTAMTKKQQAALAKCRAIMDGSGLLFPTFWHHASLSDVVQAGIDVVRITPPMNTHDNIALEDLVMSHTTICPQCGSCYDEVSEEEANSPERLCLLCTNARLRAALELAEGVSRRYGWRTDTVGNALP